ncbi:uncharacterized protein RHO25_003827 [Cercospora beticola]|uniref:Chromo domain-containing protein n=1 Tax=Cercospora beticola TaxID=122368 RepID=A0ABZ0NI52_CERBT|nr:hypothetical protein RHO25_003827 [Cercospora beticola]
MTASTAEPSYGKKYKYNRPGPVRNNEYLVEDVLDARYNSFVAGKWQYLVQWAGWPKNEASWLCRRDVDASWVEEYWRRQNASFVADRAEAASAKAFFTAAKVVTKWTRNSTRYSIFMWLTQREKAAKRAEQRAKAKRRRFR